MEIERKVTGFQEGVEALSSGVSNLNIFMKENEDAKWFCAFVAALKEDTVCKTLDLGLNQINPDGAKLIAQALRENMTLQTLSLSGNELGPTGTKLIAESLLANCGVTSLNLSSNAIGDVGASAIRRALEKNISLKELFLGWNLIGPKGTGEIANALLTNSNLTSLDLNENQLGDSGAAAIGKALEGNDQLEALDLSETKMGDEGAKRVAHALMVNTSLQTLNLENNLIGKEGALAMSKAIRSNEDIALKDLSLSWNNIQMEGGKGFADALKENESLEKLNLWSNEIGRDGTAAIENAVKANSTLVELSLEKTENDTGYTRGIVQSLVINKYLQHLRYLRLSSSEHKPLVGSVVPTVDNRWPVFVEFQSKTFGISPEEEPPLATDSIRNSLMPREVCCYTESRNKHRISVMKLNQEVISCSIQNGTDDLIRFIRRKDLVAYWVVLFRSGKKTVYFRVHELESNLNIQVNRADVEKEIDALLILEGLYSFALNGELAASDDADTDDIFESSDYLLQEHIRNDIYKTLEKHILYNCIRVGHPRILVVCGLPGSGKTMFAQRVKKWLIKVHKRMFAVAGDVEVPVAMMNCDGTVDILSGTGDLTGRQNLEKLVIYDLSTRGGRNQLSREKLKKTLPPLIILDDFENLRTRDTDEQSDIEALMKGQFTVKDEIGKKSIEFLGSENKVDISDYLIVLTLGSSRSDVVENIRETGLSHTRVEVQQNVRKTLRMGRPFPNESIRFFESLRGQIEEESIFVLLGMNERERNKMITSFLAAIEWESEYQKHPFLLGCNISLSKSFAEAFRCRMVENKGEDSEVSTARKVDMNMRNLFDLAMQKTLKLAFKYANDKPYSRLIGVKTKVGDPVILPLELFLDCVGIPPNM